MKAPVLGAKLNVPMPPVSYLPRARLDREWDQWPEKRLALVTAGAGFGKSSFLSANARKSDRPCIWFSIDELDADPASFVTHLVEAIGPLATEPLPTADTSLADSGSSLIALLMNVLRQQRRGAMLILDDAQHVAGSKKILNLLDRLIRFIPDRTTVVIASREPLGLHTAKLKSQGVLASIGAKDLRFTEDEVEALFLRRFDDAPLEEGLSRRIVMQTEGWAAGIEIFFQVCGGTSSWAIKEALNQLSSVGSGWFTYFAEEVVGRLDDRLQDFLRRSSILPQLNADLCNHVLQIENSHALLDDLSKRNLFTFPAGDDGATYRYHHLFREFLRDQLKRSLGKAEHRRLQLRLADALVKSGAWAEAAAAYAEGGDPTATLKVMEKVGEELLATGQYRVLRNAFESIPDNRLRTHPAALFILGRIQDIQGDWEDARESYERSLILTTNRSRRAELLRLLARGHIRLGDDDAAEALCRSALKEAGRRKPKLRGQILCLLAVTAAELGRLDEAERHFLEAQSILHKAGESSEEGRALYLRAANVHFYRGEFQKAKEVGRQALVIFRKLDDQRLICHTLMGIGLHAAEAAEVGEARDITKRALRMAEGLEYRMVEGYCHYALGRCALTSGDTQRAREHFDLAYRVGTQLKERAMLSWPPIGLAQAALAEGNRASARDTVQQLLRFSRKKRDRLSEARCCAILGLVEPPDKRSSAARWWRKGETILREIGTLFELHRILLFRLAAGVVTKQAERSILEELLTGTAKMEHEFLFLDLEPSRAARVLTRAIELGVEIEYTTNLLVRLGPPVVSHIAPLIEEEDSSVRESAIEILAQVGGDEARAALERAADPTSISGRSALKVVSELERAPGVPLSLNALGPFTVSVGETELSTGSWRSKRALRLLHLLLTKRFRWMSKDAVIEALWPDTDLDKAENNLRQSVHLLRKTLEPDLKETRLSKYIRFRNDAYRLDPGTGYTYDVEGFESTLQEAAKLIDQDKPLKGERRLLAAIDLYESGFLEEAPYEEFVASERERLRDRFLWAVGRVLQRYIVKKKWDECIPLSRRGLAEDPFAEDFHVALVQAHLELGNRQEALAAYHQYEQMMVRELDLIPSTRMKTFAEKATLLGGGKSRANRR